MLVAGAGVSLTLFLGAEFVIDLVAGPGFDQSVGILQVLAIALTGTFLAAARGYVLVSLGQMRSMLGANLGAVIVVIVTAIPLIQVRGAMGAAIALVLAELALTLGYEIALSYRRPSLRLPLLTLARVGAAVAIAVLPAIIFDLPSLLSAVAGLAIYLCALLLLGGIPVGLRQIFWSERVRAPGGKTD
jgi:O-antigen/teichoic acid export membrane protein